CRIAVDNGQCDAAAAVISVIDLDRVVPLAAGRGGGLLVPRTLADGVREGNRRIAVDDCHVDVLRAAAFGDDPEVPATHENRDHGDRAVPVIVSDTQLHGAVTGFRESM